MQHERRCSGRPRTWCSIGESTGSASTRWPAARGWPRRPSTDTSPAPRSSSSRRWTGPWRHPPRPTRGRSARISSSTSPACVPRFADVPLRNLFFEIYTASARDPELRELQHTLMRGRAGPTMTIFENARARGELPRGPRLPHHGRDRPGAVHRPIDVPARDARRRRPRSPGRPAPRRPVGVRARLARPAPMNRKS